MPSRILEAHWFPLVQSAGIVAGLLFASRSFRLDLRTRRVGNLIKITRQHREIWTMLYERPDLARVMDEQADVRKEPITRAEGLFVHLLILHLHSAYRAMKDGFVVKPEGLSLDVRRFSSRPIPAAVWRRTKDLHDRGFVRFVERCRRTRDGRQDGPTA